MTVEQIIEAIKKLPPADRAKVRAALNDLPRPVSEKQRDVKPGDILRSLAGSLNLGEVYDPAPPREAFYEEDRGEVRADGDIELDRLIREHREFDAQFEEIIRGKHLTEGQRREIERLKKLKLLKGDSEKGGLATGGSKRRR